MLIIADNQEHHVLGGPLISMSGVSERFITTVAIRSPLANVGSRLLMQEAIRFGRDQGAGIVLHLGDAADIGCPSELNSAFNALDTAAAASWFVAPGNHDGILAGTFVQFQPTEAALQAQTSIHTRAPAVGFPGVQKTWLNACKAPQSDVANIMTTGDAVEMYASRMRARSGADTKALSPDTLRISGTRVICKVEEITNATFSYGAIARVCPRTITTSGTFVGPYASFIVQRLDLGETRVVLLYTSHYPNPSAKNVGLGGFLGTDQMAVAETFFAGRDRKRIIVAGHHPFSDLPKRERRWISRHGHQYLSAHGHWSATLRDHSPEQGVAELNVASIVDYPSQAVIMRVGSADTRFRVAGADSTRTKWPGFLTACETNRAAWALAAGDYRSYTNGPYAMQLIQHLKRAVTKAPGAETLNVPDGTSVDDWSRLETALNDIRTSTGESRTFWACQSYYAAEATRLEKSVLDRIMRKNGGTNAVGEWLRLPDGQSAP